MDLAKMQAENELNFFRARDAKDQMEVQIDLLKARMAEFRGRAQLLNELIELQKKETPDVEAKLAVARARIAELEDTGPTARDGQGVERVVPTVPHSPPGSDL
jgi:DNA repair exonuclease SbcCD ATPase subunit